MKTIQLTSVAVSAIALAMGGAAQGAMLTFNSDVPANNATTRSAWLSAAGIVSPGHLIDFETGFAHGQNVSGVTGLFPGGLVVTDTSSDHLAQIISGSGLISNSNPVGVFSLRQNEDPYLEFDLSAEPVDYFALQDIDQAHTTGIVNFAGGATASFTLETTAGSGDSAEFWGVYRNDMPRIIKVQFDASGDVWWGVDTIEYGVVPEPTTMYLAISGCLTPMLIRRRRE